MIAIYTEVARGKAWLERYRGQRPILATVLGFTATGLIPGISAAGATPQARRYTAIADAEFLVNGVAKNPVYPLPPLTVGASPVYISRAVVENLSLPVYLFNAGLLHPPSVPYIDLNGRAAHCVSTGAAMPLDIVTALYQQGLKWGEKLAIEAGGGYIIIGECVVGGTTTALSLLTALGIEARGKVNSSHPRCNHEQKWSIVQEGLSKLQNTAPFSIIAAIGDPMQIVAAGMAIKASERAGVLLAGGTQMLAVYALMGAIEPKFNRDSVVVGTTSWVARDPSGDTVGLAEAIGEVPLLATGLNFSRSSYQVLRVYEEGFVKEGVGAGGCAIAASLYKNWTNTDLVGAIELLLARSE
ncbi:MAG: hypothetical protein N5P05_001697 [Chroococcopsis gigantea SAG 12.99]|jgi:uncharacterized protein (TIGR00303 family)|nr:TIGR00303 family protein [Chlorogloea purpurea SAG 13.99]MDV3000091.1 hypothetical protein [Chroococcopsis gigantea SAG 12.99]